MSLTPFGGEQSAVHICVLVPLITTGFIKLTERFLSLIKAVFFLHLNDVNSKYMDFYDIGPCAQHALFLMRFFILCVHSSVFIGCLHQNVVQAKIYIVKLFMKIKMIQAFI